MVAEWRLIGVVVSNNIPALDSPCSLGRDE